MIAHDDSFAQDMQRYVCKAPFLLHRLSLRAIILG